MSEHGTARWDSWMRLDVQWQKRRVADYIRSSAGFTLRETCEVFSWAARTRASLAYCAPFLEKWTAHRDLLAGLSTPALSAVRWRLVELGLMTECGLVIHSRIDALEPRTAN